MTRPSATSTNNVPAESRVRDRGILGSAAAVESPAPSRVAKTPALPLGDTASVDCFVAAGTAAPGVSETSQGSASTDPAVLLERVDFKDARYREALRPLVNGPRPITMEAAHAAIGAVEDDGDSKGAQFVRFVEAFWRDFDLRAHWLYFLIQAHFASERGLPPLELSPTCLGDRAGAEGALTKLLRQSRPISGATMRRAILSGTRQGDPLAANAVYEIYRSFYQAHAAELDVKAQAAFLVYERFVRAARSRGELALQSGLADEMAAVKYQSACGARLIERLKGLDPAVDLGKALAQALVTALSAPDAELPHIAADFVTFAKAYKARLGGNAGLPAFFACAVGRGRAGSAAEPGSPPLPIDRDKLREALLRGAVYEPNLLDYLSGPAPTGKGSGAELKVIGGSLVVGGMKPADVGQGDDLGDCSFCSCCASLAHCRPELLQDRIDDNGDGTYTVRFYVPTPESPGVCELPVLVDGRLFVRADGEVLYGKAPGAGEKRKLWFAIIEKAFAALRGGYGAIASLQPWFALSLLTGAPCSIRSCKGEPSDVAWLKEKLDAGQPCIINQTDYEYSMPAGVHAGHAYSALGSVEHDGRLYFILRNPWGFGEPPVDGVDDGVFWLPAEDVVSSFNEATTVVPPIRSSAVPQAF